MKFNAKILAISGIALILILSIGGCFISKSNAEIDLRNSFTQASSERTTIYDNKVYKVVAQKTQIALKNDSSFIKVVNAQMEGQKDAPGLFMKWIQQSNPTATFTEVSALYKDLGRTVESVRTEFVEQEKKMQDIKKQHDNLLSKFPSSIVLSILGRKHLVYKPITSDKTDKIMTTGKDNDINIFQ